MKDTHAALRVMCFKHGVSMQDVFEELSQNIAAEMPQMIAFLNAVALKKKNKEIKKFSNSDAETIFSVIQQESPLSND